MTISLLVSTEWLADRLADPDVRVVDVRWALLERDKGCCGSGINPCQNLLALQIAGFDGGPLYEGSWSDWCSVPTREMIGAEP